MVKIVTSSDRIIRDPEFAKRFEQAADMNPHCPPLHLGRLVWIGDQMKKKGCEVSKESIRKWFYGEARPRPQKGDVLAEILGVDPVWLMMGIDANMGPRERKVRRAVTSAGVNIIAGLIQMDGGHPAFPAENDARAQQEFIDLYAIIRGANYSLHVSSGVFEGDKVRFIVPTQLGENVIVLGLLRDGFSFQVFEVTPEVIEQHGEIRGGSAELNVNRDTLRQITSFAERL